MHKSCKVLVHSRAKFPFEDGFVCTSKRLKKAATDDNTAPLIKGMYVVLNQKYFLNKYLNHHYQNLTLHFKGVCIAKNGMVYPCRRKIKNPSKKAPTTKQTFKNVPNSSSDVIIPIHVQDEIEQQQPIIEQFVEPIFTIVSPNQEYVIGKQALIRNKKHFPKFLVK